VSFTEMNNPPWRKRQNVQPKNYYSPISLQHVVTPKRQNMTYRHHANFKSVNQKCMSEATGELILRNTQLLYDMKLLAVTAVVTANLPACGLLNGQ